jgi:hypothetical protein
VRLKEVIWETADAYMPLNRVEAAMYIERHVKDSLNAGGFDLQPKAIAHAEGTNMVCTSTEHMHQLFGVDRSIKHGLTYPRNISSA